MFLPTYSPHLNPIENHFKWMREECIQCRDFRSEEDVIQAINDWLAYYNGLRKEVHSQPEEIVAKESFEVGKIGQA